MRRSGIRKRKEKVDVKRRLFLVCSISTMVIRENRE